MTDRHLVHESDADQSQHTFNENGDLVNVRNRSDAASQVGQESMDQEKLNFILTVLKKTTQ